MCTYGSPAASSSRYLEDTWSLANTVLANFMATWRTCTSGWREEREPRVGLVPGGGRAYQSKHDSNKAADIGVQTGNLSAENPLITAKLFLPTNPESELKNE